MRAEDSKQNEVSFWNALLATAWVAFAAVGRLVPHVPNFTPTTSICLFSAVHFSRRWALLVAIVAMILSDLLLAPLHGLGAFGWWSLFTYSGIAAIVTLGTWLRKKVSAERAVGCSLAATLGFWLWTNFGTWMVSGMYERSLAGFVQCYTLALPFLGWAVVGDLAWTLGLFLSFSAASKALPQSKSTAPVSR